MSEDLAKFIPSDMRLQIAQSVIEARGIRPLARELDVNPKSVYKYKKGTSHPRIEIMTKLLAIADKEDSVPLEDFLKRLSEEFSNAMESPIEPGEELEEIETEESGAQVEENKEGKTVDRKPTEEKEETQSVEQEPTKTMEFREICQKIGVKNPFDQSKVRKILKSLTESQQLSVSEIVEQTKLSEEAVEKYLEKMIEEQIVQESSDNNFNLRVKMKGGE